jgi:hypothetical protein
VTYVVVSLSLKPPVSIVEVRVLRSITMHIDVMALQLAKEYGRATCFKASM